MKLLERENGMKCLLLFPCETDMAGEFAGDVCLKCTGMPRNGNAEGAKSPALLCVCLCMLSGQVNVGVEMEYG